MLVAEYYFESQEVRNQFLSQLASQNELRKYLAHARDLEPGNAEVQFFFGIASIELNLGNEAYDALKKAVALSPENPYVNYAMGAVARLRAAWSVTGRCGGAYCARSPPRRRAGGPRWWAS